jgi:hypothetical protein
LSQRRNDPTKAIVLKDVARDAGVDASTVSRVLRGDARKPAKAETRERILQIARKLGYRPNSVARSLRTRRTEAIGLVIPDAANPGFAEIFKGVQAATAIPSSAGTGSFWRGGSTASWCCRRASAIRWSSASRAAAFRLCWSTGAPAAPPARWS